VSRAALVVVPASAQTEPDPPSVEEAARILSEAWAVEPEWGLLVWLTMVTGSRRGEVSALRWRDLDSARGLLVIRRSNARPKAGVKEMETKTRQQRRVALDPQTLELLTVHRGRWEQRCADLGCELEPTAYPSPRRLDPVAAAVAAPAVRPPGQEAQPAQHPPALTAALLRHRTDRRRRGHRTVAGRLGHGSGGATTLKIYAAWVDEAGRQRAARTMAGIMPQLTARHRRLPRSPIRRNASDVRPTRRHPRGTVIGWEGS